MLSNTAGGVGRTDGGLAAVFRRGRDLLAPIRGRAPAAARALDRLERDLLPRSAGGDVYLVAGIVGPNNSGKSALFNSLVGRSLSPSVPSGGATRRLVGAAHPELLARLRAEPTLARFRLRPLGEEAAGSEAALQPAADPAELLIATERDMPPGLMLIDTPDFDSILEDNRLASESLLAVADLVIAVVTRHSYQNREVVRFLERWFEHGRPWVLVYNEASDAEVSRSHAAKLAGDVGTPPLAAFWAPHSLAVQEGREGLDPESLRLGEAGPGVARRHLRDMLFDLEQIADVKARSFAASVAQLRADVVAASAVLDDEAARAQALLAAAEARASAAGSQVASAAMPVGPFIEAFRTVLDRRSNALSRGWRTSVRQVRVMLESVASMFRASRPEIAVVSTETVSLAAVECRQLRKVWPLLWEDLARDLGPEARHPARQSCRAAMAALLDGDLAEGRRSEALQRAEKALATEPAGLERFRQACEDLVDDAIEERGFDLDIQAAADISTLAPLAIAAAIIIKTGGVGADIAVAGGGAVSTFLAEKYAHLLGSGITASARRRWTSLRAGELTRVLVGAALPQSAPALRTSVRECTDVAERLRAFEAELG